MRDYAFGRSGRADRLQELADLPLGRLLSPASDCAADSIWEEADPVSLAPRCTSMMLAETGWGPWAACCTLREISCVAAPCSSTAAAMAEEISDSVVCGKSGAGHTHQDECRNDQRQDRSNSKLHFYFPSPSMLRQFARKQGTAMTPKIRDKNVVLRQGFR